MNKKTNNNKTRYYRLLAIAKKQLCWDDDYYRDEFLTSFGATKKDGKVSASTMSLSQLMAAFEHTKKCGFKVQHKKNNVSNISDWRQPRIKKLTAMWITLAAADVVRDRSETAMAKYCARITKKQKLQWYDSHELNMCIESLKSWALRAGVELQ